MKATALNNGVEVPALDFGVFQTPPDETRDIVALRGAGEDCDGAPVVTGIRPGDHATK